MLVLDTNVVSELMKEHPNPAEVPAWLDRQSTHTLCLTTVTEAEIRTGIAIMPDGKRQRELLAAAERVFGVFFAERILPFDREAAQACAMIAAQRRASGHPVSQADCRIVAMGPQSRGIRGDQG